MLVFIRGASIQHLLGAYTLTQLPGVLLLEFDGAVQIVVLQPLVPQKCRLQMNEWIRFC